jgi:hypothetical protein
MRAFFLSKAVYDNYMKLTLLFILFSSCLYAKSGRIYSLGFGLNGVSSSSNSIDEVASGSFIRLSHEGLLAKKLLYVVGAGFAKNDLKVNYNYEGDSSTTAIDKFDASSTRIEGRLGLKYNIVPWFYIGAGAIAGDFQVEYERDDFIEESSATENFVKSENQNYFGSYGELGIMHVYKNLGFRLGTELSNVTISQNLKTLGDSKPVLSDQKFYIEILWKN